MTNYPSDIKPGMILNEQAYARGKMLDHSGMVGQLARGSMPSDIDFILDNNGSMIFAELSRWMTEWTQTSKGQRWLYESLIKTGIHCAVLCKHSVELETRRKIYTWTDIESFQIMIWHHGMVITEVIQGQEKWQSFIKYWFDPLKGGPLRTHRFIIYKTLASLFERPKLQNVIPISSANRKP
jgi:hypothetical protein